MFLTRNIWQKMLSQAVITLKANTDELSKLDAAIGDGDHGVTIGKIADKIQEHLNNWPNNMTVVDFLENVSNALTNIGGGSAGPLWGTLFEGFAAASSEEMDVEQSKKLFSSALEAIGEISPAKKGDKTMLDTLISAVEAAKTYKGNDIAQLMEAVAIAAKQGSDDTVNMIAKFGRAKNLKEKSLGHKDPGSVSLALLFSSFAQALK